MKHTFLLCITLAAAMLTGCSLDIPYENQFSDPDAITSPTTARELLSQAYSQLPNPELDLALLTDDLSKTYWAQSNPSMLNLYNWQPQALQDLSQSLWSGYYAVIATLNTLSERLPAVEGDEALIAEIGAEAKTLKAYCYFQLLRLYGPTPRENAEAKAIVLKDAVAMQELPRSTVAQSVAEIRRLLTEALEVETRSKAGTADWLGLEATRLLLADVELYAGNYPSAASEAQTVIDNVGTDALSASAYDALWAGNPSAARIWGFAHLSTANGFYLGLMYDRNSGDYFALDAALAASYRADDCRRAWSVWEVTTPTMGYQPYLGKYNALRKQQKEITVVNKLRLEDALFIAAEAYAHTDAPRAVALLNDYLTRRGAETVDASLSGDALLRAVLAEKRKEFAGEGTRYFDLKRHRAGVLSAWTAGQPADRRVSADDYRWLLPIPRDEYLYNPQMDQNPTWPKTSFND